MRRAASILIVAAALGVVLPARAVPPSCAGQPRAGFVGIVYDSAQRADFQRDVDNFRATVESLRGVYCLEASDVRMLAFDRNYVRDGIWYPAGTEAGFKHALRDVGARAATELGMPVFIMLSSHGLFYTRPGPGCTGIGSYAQLMAGDGEDGRLYDCELGDVLRDAFAPTTPLAIVIDCSFCGGFSDSLTAASGTLRDDIVSPSSVPAPGRIVITGCAVTTECFGGSAGGVLYGHLRATMDVTVCDGYTAPGFPTVQGINAPVRTLAPDGRCGLSEWFFAAVASAYASGEPIDIQEQFRIKYGYGSLEHDIRVL